MPSSCCSYPLSSHSVLDRRSSPLLCLSPLGAQHELNMCAVVQGDKEAVGANFPFVLAIELYVSVSPQSNTYHSSPHLPLSIFISLSLPQRHRWHGKRHRMSELPSLRCGWLWYGRRKSHLATPLRVVHDVISPLCLLSSVFASYLISSSEKNPSNLAREGR